MSGWAGAWRRSRAGHEKYPRTSTADSPAALKSGLGSTHQELERHRDPKRRVIAITARNWTTSSDEIG